MLTGRVPFTGDSAVSIALKHVSDQPPPLREVRPDVHPALEAAIMRALSKDPAARYQNADEFIAALEAARAAIRSGEDGGHTESWAPVPAPLPLEEDPHGRRRWPWVTLLLLLLLGGLALAFLLTRPDQVTVPKLVGRQAPDAAAALVNAKLKPKVIQVKSEKEVGIVIRQDPAAGKKVEKSSTVKLYVSSGPGFTTVPDVSGKSQAQAVRALNKAHLSATIKEEQSATVPKGFAIRTDPPALNQEQVGSHVDLFISTGPPQVTVPGVVGKQRPDAVAALQDAGLKVTVHDQDSTEPKGRVLSQAPVAGTRVTRGSRVTITVSRGIQKVDVPDVVGRSQDEASGILQGAGFTVRSMQVAAPAAQEGKVVRQKPGGGSQEDKGSTVTIYVGKPKNQNQGGGGGTGGGGTGQSAPPAAKV
jgi:serine/threonine-protein kinase